MNKTNELILQSLCPLSPWSMVILAGHLHSGGVCNLEGRN